MPELAISGGIEVETEYAMRGSYGNFPSKVLDFFNPDHDGSIESPMRILPRSGLLIERNSTLGQFVRSEEVVVGTEFVSNILDLTDRKEILNILTPLTGYLAAIGEPRQSYRAGIHVHVCFTSPQLRMLKNTLKLWRNLEEAFFLIGGMGYDFRGARNDSAYCRPLTKHGPIIVQTENGYAKTVDLDDLLSASTIDEFWNRWGDLPHQAGSGQRYFPVRYHAFNLSPAAPYPGAKGTIEFRVFNKSLNPLFILAIMRLSQVYTEYCAFQKIEDGLEEHSVFDLRPKDKIIGNFLRFVENTSLEGTEIETLVKIMERSPQLNLGEWSIVSHLRNVSPHWNRHEYNYKLVPTSRLKHPEIVDLRSLRGN